jgi:hypothetical protein
MTTIYRNYQIAKVGDLYVAQAGDDECLLISSNQKRLNLAIDDLWSSLERGMEPAWFSGSTAIDLDSYGPETNPSETDPPPTTEYKDQWVSFMAFGATALLVSGSAAALMEISSFHERIDAIFTLTVCAVAIVLGSKYALLLSCLLALVFNFVEPPGLFQFSAPGFGEIVHVAIDVVASIAIPMIVNNRGSRWRFWA